MLPSKSNSLPLTDDYLFVYGTLMNGFDNPFSAQLAAYSAFAGQGYFPGKLYWISYYPGALYIPGASTYVHGEIYRLRENKQLLTLLDEYEGVSPDVTKSLYLRQITPISTQNGDIIPCWTYIYNQTTEDLQEIADGKFPRP